MSRAHYEWKGRAKKTRVDELRSKVLKDQKEYNNRVESYLENLNLLEKTDEQFLEASESYIETCVRERTRELRREVESLQKQLKDRPSVPLSPEVDKSLIKKASSICVFDSLIFAMENWATDGQVAPDVSLCSQSILFPLVYEPVMRGDSDYFVDSFPAVSLEVVRRGREFVKWLRETSPTSLSDRDTWETYSKFVQEWWVNDALPLLYGARSDEWVISSSYDFDTMVKWRDMPASRALDFPLIFDGMELKSKQMDNIREPMGLPNFMQTQNQTRIEL